MPRLSRELLAGQEDSLAYDDAMHKRLEDERQAVLRCVAASANTTHVGHKVEAVAKCVPAAVDPARALPKRQVFWDAVASGQVPAHNESEARAAGQVSRLAGLEGLVWTDPSILLHNRDLYLDGHVETVTAVGNLLQEAERMLEMPVDTIPDKAFVPPDGDKKSYVSLSTYCWPSNPDDLENPKGPWECRDGQPFPGRNVIAPDFEKLARVQRNSFNLALAYFFSADKRYAKHAAAIIRAFFLDPQTGMNPHLRFAQLSPGTGNEAGEPYGTIDNKAMAMVFDAVAILSESTWWMPEDATRMARWASEYVLHLQSAHCRSEMAQENNHGTLFDVQYTAFLKFLGRDEAVVEYLEAAAKPRMRGQIFGSMMPAEMARPISYAYHNFELEAYVRLAMQADRVLLNLWSFGSESGNSVLDAWDWMAQHWCDRNETLWPVAQLANGKLDMDRPVVFAGAVYAHAAARASVPDAYTLRSRFYALSWHSFRAGPDPGKYVKWNFALTRQLSLVKFDDCFISTCPDRRVLPEHPPTYPAFCLPSAEQPMPYLDAFRGRWPEAGGATADILPALTRGDPLPEPHATATVGAAAGGENTTVTAVTVPTELPGADGSAAVDSEDDAHAAEAVEDEGSEHSTDSTDEATEGEEDAGGEEEDAGGEEEGGRDEAGGGDEAGVDHDGKSVSGEAEGDSGDEGGGGEEGGGEEGGGEEGGGEERGTEEGGKGVDKSEGATLGAHEQSATGDRGDELPELELESARHAAAALPTGGSGADDGADGWAGMTLESGAAAWTESWQASVPSAALIAFLCLIACLVRHRARHRFRKIA
eukprot:jgi/Ulvmu1/3727/UM172_0005.1